MTKLHDLALILPLLTIFFLALIISLGGGGVGETFIVDDDGGGHADHTSIQDALDNVTNGDTIRVWDGVYNESITIDRSVQVIGNGTNSTVIGWSSGLYSPFDISNGRIVINADNVTLRDLHVKSENTYYNGPGILVKGNDTTIRNLSIADFLVSILLNASHRSTILDNHLEGYYAGIAFLDSGNHTLPGNRFDSMFWNFEVGVYNSWNITLDDCFHNTSRGKVRIENSHGIVVRDIPYLEELTIDLSKNITVLNTTSELTDTTITLTSSSHVHLMNNTMGEGGIGIWGESPEHWTTHTITDSNTANGEPYLYLTHRRSEKISGRTGPIILANCSDIQLSNISCNFTYAGILSGFSSNISISHSQFRSNEYGVRFIGSSPGSRMPSDTPPNHGSSPGSSWDRSYTNLIRNCTFLHNEIGLSLESSNDSLIRNCSFLMNTMGLIIYSQRGDIVDNNFTYNREIGIEIIGGRGHTVQGNKCSRNGKGILVSGSDDNIIQQNTCSDNTHGIELSGVENNTLEYNLCTGNREDGIFLDYSSYNYLRNNTLTYNRRAGLRIDHGRNNMILNHSVSFNNDGIHILSSSYWNTLIDSYIHHNIIGVRISGSYVDENTIMDNVIVFNSEFGANVTLSPAYPIDLSRNWWGSPSGPYHPSANPTGAGDNVTNFTEFSPWLHDWGDERFHRKDVPIDPSGDGDTDDEDGDEKSRILLYVLFLALGTLLVLLIGAVYFPSILASRSSGPLPHPPGKRDGHDTRNGNQAGNQGAGAPNLAASSTSSPPPPSTAPPSTSPHTLPSNAPPSISPSNTSSPVIMNSIPCSHCGEMINLGNHTDSIRVPCPHCGRESVRTTTSPDPVYQKLL